MERMDGNFKINTNELIHLEIMRNRTQKEEEKLNDFVEQVKGKLLSEGADLDNYDQCMQILKETVTDM